MLTIPPSTTLAPPASSGVPVPPGPCRGCEKCSVSTAASASVVEQRPARSPQAASPPRQWPVVALGIYSITIALTLALLTATASAITPTTAPDHRISSPPPAANQYTAAVLPSFDRPHNPSPSRKVKPAGLMRRLLPDPLLLY